ncbi:helix-turn-helix transcriptional regulator [Actinoplanes sp. NPDC049118]|uniref:helix-turn-helix domain-containing protein n=1 Tax=Actinoplanes sp. NPDC049118 TaxID=3155769 RepID=UPI0033C78A20
MTRDLAGCHAAVSEVARYRLDLEGKMTEGVVSPNVARRRVRLALREARETAGHTQLQVAEEMEWSLSKVIRIENGDVTIAPNDLRALLTYLGIKDKATVAAMLTDAKISRTRSTKPWWQDSKYRTFLSDSLRKLIEYEAEALAIRYYNVHFLPGPLQTPAYAESLLSMWAEEMPDGQIDARLEARRLRHEALLSRVGKFDLFLLLDQSVLLRPIGGNVIFADQLRLLHELATAGQARIRMIPFDPVTPLTNNASFDLVTLSDDDGGLLLYRENGLSDELVEDKESTARHRARFDKVWNAVTDEAATMEFIAGRIRALEANHSSRPGYA